MDGREIETKDLALSDVISDDGGGATSAREDDPYVHRAEKRRHSQEHLRGQQPRFLVAGEKRKR